MFGNSSHVPEFESYNSADSRTFPYLLVPPAKTTIEPTLPHLLWLLRVSLFSFFFPLWVGVCSLIRLFCSGMGSYFSLSQWQELELQALIFRYMLAGAAVPPELLQPIKKSLLHSPHYFLHHPLQHYQPAACNSLSLSLSLSILLLLSHIFIFFTVIHHFPYITSFSRVL